MTGRDFKCCICGNKVDTAIGFATHANCPKCGLVDINDIERCMTFNEVLNDVVNDGLIGVERDYANSPDKLKGAIEGFEACRNKDISELQALLTLASNKTKEARELEADNYWEVRCFEAEVEWVCNSMSAYLVFTGQDLPIGISPTARAVLNIDKILRKQIN
jgi:predicted RNA-binding Zn-ribbon protein involved in translation (DUF1610 family)